MRPIVNALTVDDMAAVAAYLGSLPPQRGTKH
jgi:cytochrome c553